MSRITNYLSSRRGSTLDVSLACGACILSLAAFLWSCSSPETSEPEETAIPVSAEKSAGSGISPEGETFPEPLAETPDAMEPPAESTEAPGAPGIERVGRDARRKAELSAMLDEAAMLLESPAPEARDTDSPPVTVEKTDDEVLMEALLLASEGEPSGEAFSAVSPAVLPSRTPRPEPLPASVGIDLEAAGELLAQAAARESEAPGSPAVAEATQEAAPATDPEATRGVKAEESGKPPKKEEGAAQKQEEGKEEGGEAPSEPAARPLDPAPAPAPKRPDGLVTIKEMWHKTSDEFINFCREMFPEWIENGHVHKVAGKGRSILIVGATDKPDDPLTVRILEVVDAFDDLELQLTSKKLRPRYVDVATVMDALTMRGLANVWRMTDVTNTFAWQEGKKNRTVSSQGILYARMGITPGEEPPIPIAPKVPYIYEIASTDPFQTPLEYGGENNYNQPLIDFRNQSSTEERGSIMAVGTEEDIAAIEAFIETIDVPARQIMIEVEVVQLDARKLTDLGIDSIQFGDRHTLGTVSNNLPGETITQPGFGDEARRNPDQFVPDITDEGFGLIFDDTSQDITGRFIANVHALVREGDATVKARPKILTLDDRVSVLHIGRDIPVFKSSGVTRDATVGTFVSNVDNVDNIYVGFTLNIRPRIAGGSEDEVSLQIEVNINGEGERQRVFEEDLLGIPDIFRRRYVGQNRVKNHRPIILGGLIEETETESINKIPILGDIPYLGYLFRRTVTQEERQEIIMILTPHILSEKGWDRFAAPKESPHFDTFDSVLFNDTHVLKGRDIIGIDPITGSPARGKDGKLFSEEQVVDLTLLNVARQRELVSKLGILDDYLGDSAKELNWVQRKWPEATVHSWPEEKREIFFRALAILIENIKELNPDLTYDEVVVPRRTIVLPTSPYRISLSYDKVKALQRDFEGNVGLRTTARVPMDATTVEKLREASGRSLREFADFLATSNRTAEDHGEMLAELKRLYTNQEPTSNALENIPYPEVYQELARAGFDFMSIATYFSENLNNRYTMTGKPDVRNFPADLEAFLETSVSLQERARKLMELDEKWHQMNSEEEPEDPYFSDSWEGGRERNGG